MEPSYTHKQCTECGLSHPLAEFGRNKRTRDGLQSRCKACVNRRHRADYTPTENLTRDWTVYALTDPNSNEIRYVGSTVQKLYARLNNHLWDARRRPHESPVWTWISQLLEINQRPKIRALEVAETQTQAEQLEEGYIQSLRVFGNILNNREAGANGRYFDTSRIKASNQDAYKEPQSKADHSRVMGGPGWIVCLENGNRYPSQSAAAKALKLCSSNVGKVIRGICSHTGGYSFAPANDNGSLE